MFFLLFDKYKNVTGVFKYRFHGELFNEFNHECQRYDSISDWAVDKVLGCNYVGLEGYAYGASGRAIFQIAENCGLLKYKLWEAGITVDVIAPTKIKRSNGKRQL